MNKIPQLKIVPPKKSAFVIDTPDWCPKLHTLMVISARRGLGKSTAISNYVSMLKRENLIDRCLLITPTWYSNQEIWEPLKLNQDDIFQPEKGVLKKIESIIDSERAEWDAFLANKEKWHEVVNSDRPISSYPPHFLQALIDNKFLEPKWKYQSELPPRLFLIIDDSLGFPIYKPTEKLTSFVATHRHLGKGLGISVAMLVQTYKCGSCEGISRPIRENATMLCLGKLKDMNQMEGIFSEIGSDISFERFKQIFEKATNQPYGFLTIDFAPKRPEHMFRSRFDEIIDINTY